MDSNPNQVRPAVLIITIILRFHPFPLRRAPHVSSNSGHKSHSMRWPVRSLVIYLWQLLYCQESSKPSSVFKSPADHPRRKFIDARCLTFSLSIPRTSAWRSYGTTRQAIRPGCRWFSSTGTAQRFYPGSVHWRSVHWRSVTSLGAGDRIYGKSSINTKKKRLTILGTYIS